ncbi:hypothetical protein AB204_10535 [Xenorhabdus khoisanae]|uniref:Zinc-ribbon domain-containing protein n=1 Tax=Xenorhabdus khoisanae TaxID=880157 RepID=A0A0J5FT82_9GAMM|nr:zinc ribbon domain-containing protein [Xenorhabdus khoisanae]KMJ45127.1 hypothetical protein AB204_10535 [Xenorhabdus khoisanae]
MVFCTACGKEIAENDNFCSTCGKTRGGTSIVFGDNSFNALNSEIKDNVIHVGDSYTNSNNIDPSTLNIQRSFVKLPWSKEGKLAKRSTFLKLGTWGSLASIAGIFLPFLTGNYYLHSIALIALVFSLPILLMGLLINRFKFQHLLGLQNLEIGLKENIYLTKITCDCPWCKSEMKLRMIGSKEHRQHLLICARNPSQHRIIFDPTVLPNIEE